jgi:acetyl-CoA carboxylase biotin carboxylase subunit
MADEEYRRGDVTIQWLEAKLPVLLGAKPPAETVRAAAIAAALIAESEKRGRTANGNGSLNGEVGEVKEAEGPMSSWASLARREGLRS